MKHSASPYPIVHSVVHRTFLLALIAAALSFYLVGTETASAEDAEKPLPDKSSYNLFHPTPDNVMRELTPDRPDKTESPYTVDAGHFQVEMSFVEFTKNQSGQTVGPGIGKLIT